jgi:hypothetical protein
MDQVMAFMLETASEESVLARTARSGQEAER